MSNFRLRRDPPANEADFERLCLKLLQAHWKIPTLELLGRRGERQHGIDILDMSGAEPIHAAQCRLYESTKSLPPAEILAEVEKAKGFHPPIDHLAFLTTAKVSVQAQRTIITINREHRKRGLFSVDLLTWNQIDRLLDEYPAVRDDIYKSVGGETIRNIEEGLSHLRNYVTGAVVVESDALHAEIEEAKQLILQHEYQLARFVLERLRRSKWEHMASRHQFRLITNLATTYLGEGSFSKAASLFLQAKAYQPDDEQARANEALAHQISGDSIKAHQLADQLRRQFPYSSRILALWIQTAPADKAFALLQNEVPPVLAANAEVCIALAVHALFEGLFDTADELAAKAEQAQPTWSYPKILRGRATVLRALAEHDITEFQGCRAEREQLALADQYFTEALELAEAERSAGAKAECLVERSTVRRILQDDGRADDDVYQAQAQTPDDPTVIRCVADVEARRGNTERAILLLREAIAKVLRPDLQLRLAELLRRRNSGTDTREASDLLLNLVRRTEKMPQDMRKHVASLALEALTAEQRWSEAESLCLDLAAVYGLVPLFVASVRARLALIRGDLEKANEEATRANQEVADDSPREDLRYLAVLLSDLGRFADALPVWRRVAPASQLSSDTKRLLDCAARLKRDDLILETCRSLRENGVESRELVLYELDYLEKYDIEDAIRLTHDYLQAHPEDNFIRLRRSRIGLRWHRPEIVEADPAKMPAVGDVKASVGLAVVQVMKLGGYADAALEYSYELVREHFGDPDAHRALMFNLHPISPHPTIPSFTEVAVGAAVAYIEEGENEERWLVIEGSRNPDPTRDEYPPSHSLSAGLLGKKVGDKFVLASGSIANRTGRITAIQSKYVYRYQDSLKNWQIRFPEESELESVKVVTRSEATGEEIFDPTAIFAALDRRYEHTRKVLHLYRTEAIPIHLVAERLGKTSLETMEALAVEDSGVIVCCSGGLEEREAATSALDISHQVVLHSTALASLALLGLETAIHRWPMDMVVAQGTLAELEEVLSHARMFTDQGGTLGKTDGGYFMVEITPEEREGRRVKLEQLISTIKSTCKVIGCRQLAAVEPEKREVMLKGFGRSGAESILLAAHPGCILWTDDHRMARFAGPEFGVRCVWTQVALGAAASKGSIETEEFITASAKLLGWKYHFTSPSPPVLIKAGRLAEWRPERWPLAAALEQFGDESIVLQDSLILLASFLRMLYREPILPQTKDLVLIRVLENFSTRPGGLQAVRALRKVLPQLMGVNVLGAEEAQTAIDAWLLTKGPSLA